MIEIRTDGLVVKIPIELLKALLIYVQDDNNKPESGGVLVGYYIESNIYSITDVSYPSDEDISSRFSFNRSQKKVQKIINDLHAESKGKKIYLGEWHTHPEDNPNPSIVDVFSIVKQFTLNTLNAKTIFMIIIGRESIYIGKVYKKGVRQIGSVKLNELN